jgi:4-amino-4-deoxy-L-arabinose transferase-like glycosyltransferase
MIMEFIKKYKIVSVYLILLFVLNMFQGGLVELSYDETYYWMYSQFMSWGYFDHPPMVAVFIKLGYSLFQNEFGVRLFFNIFGVGAILLLWLMTNRKNETLFVLLSLSYPLVQAAGFLALPDTPLLFFATLFLFLVKKYLKDDGIKNSVFLGLCIACLFYSKYHGLAVVLFTVLGNLNFFKRKSFYLVILITVISYMPHMYWQYLNDFISFKFHLFGRVEKHFEIKNILNYLTSQIALFGFVNFFVLLFISKKINFKDTWEKILFSNVFGFLILLFFMSFRNQIEANWTVTACMSSLLLFMILIERTKAKKVLFISSIFPILLILVLRLIILMPSSFYEGKSIDRLNEIKGWTARINKIKETIGDTTVVAETYQYGAKISFYLERIIPVKHFQGRSSHYSLLNLTKKIDLDEEIYYITPRKTKDAVRIETGYKDPVYIYKTTLRRLEEKYGKPNEEII